MPASFYTGINSFDPQPLSSWLGTTYWPVYYSVQSFDRLGSVLFNTTSDVPTMNAAPCEVVESDIWRRDGDTLYLFNQNRGLQIIDLTNPAAARILGTLNLPAAGEQMYLLSSNHVVLLTRTTIMIQMSVVALTVVAVAAVLVVLAVVCVRAIGTWVRQLWPH